MSALRAATIDELCHTLGLRTPIGVMTGLHVPTPTVTSDIYSDSGSGPEVARLTDEELCALGVLASPEALAVVTQWPTPQPFAPPVPVVHVIATRGPWLAEHVIEGDAHHLHAADADNAAMLLLDRCGFVEPSADGAGVINTTLHTYRRMTELVKVGDTRRARATLIADGANGDAADALVAAEMKGRVEVAGLAIASAGGQGADGHRFVGCDLAVAGDATTGRWLVPASQHVDVPKHALRHPAFGGSGNVRVIVEEVGTDALHDELALIFGDV